MYAAPQVTLDSEITDFYAFTPESVIVTDYKYDTTPTKFEVAV